MGGVLKRRLALTWAATLSSQAHQHTCPLEVEQLAFGTSR